MLLRNFVAWLVRDGFVQIGIEFLPDRFDRLQTMIGEKIVELFQDQAHTGIDRRLLAFAARGFEAELEVVDDRDKFLEQPRVGELDPLFFFAGATLFVILEVGLAAERQIPKAIEIGLHTRHGIIAVFSRSRRRCRSCGRVGIVGFLHVLRMAIKVMSSFCGCEPTKLRRSSITRVIIADAPLPALACTAWMVRSKPNSVPSASSASVTPSV